MGAYFDTAWKDLIAQCGAIATGRGDEYGDSWGEDADFSEIRNTFKLIFGMSPTDEQCRIVVLSALVNAKQNRKLGGHKEDTDMDLINYTAVKTYAIQQYLKSFGEAQRERSQ